MTMIADSYNGKCLTSPNDGVIHSDGTVWTFAADGAHCITPQGDVLGRILVPEIVSAPCFGGCAKHHLCITATTSLYAIPLNRHGAQQP